MARGNIVAPSADLVSDSGSVLWSIVKGEQLEFPITLNFLDIAGNGYTFEAVVVEALNIVGQTDKPVTVKSGGVQTVLNVRVPAFTGVWNSSGSYNREDVVSYNGLYYKLSAGVNRVSITVPSSDAVWEVYVPNKVYIQFPTTLGATWTVQPTAETETYGFFELRVTEPAGGVFQRTWKPMRGMVEISFSPTDIVP